MKFRITKIQGIDFLLELIAVVLGITIAFTVDQWQETKSDRNLELKWLHSIKSDIQGTSPELLKLRDKDSIQNKSVKQFMHLLDTSSKDKVTVSKEIY